MGAKQLNNSIMDQAGLTPSYVEAIADLAGASEGLAILSENNVYLFANAKFSEHLGLPEQLEGSEVDQDFLITAISNLSEKCAEREVLQGENKLLLKRLEKNSKLTVIRSQKPRLLESPLSDMQMLDELKVSLCKLSGSEKVLYCNKSFAYLVNKNTEELVGKELPSEGILDAIDMKRILTLASSRSRKTQVVGFCVNTRRPDGSEGWFDIEIVSVGEDEESCFLIRAKQVDDIRRTHRQLKDSQNALLYSERMAALGEMANGVAHEINNPLAIINGSAYVLQTKFKQAYEMDEAEAEACAKFLTTITTTCKRVSSIVSGLRVFASARKNRECTNIVTELFPVIEEVQEHYRERFNNSGIEFSEQDCEKDIKVYVQKNHLTQALMNLLNNSIEVTRGREAPKVFLQYEVTEKVAKILVIDNGPGVPKTVANRIFEPFYSTKKHQKIGIGLGLSVAKGLIESQGGRLYLNSEGELTTFVIEIPRAD